MLKYFRKRQTLISWIYPNRKFKFMTPPHSCHCNRWVKHFASENQNFFQLDFFSSTVGMFRIHYFFKYLIIPLKAAIGHDIIKQRWLSVSRLIKSSAVSMTPRSQYDFKNNLKYSREIFESWVQLKVGMLNKTFYKIS